VYQRGKIELHISNNDFLHSCFLWSGSLASVCGVTIGTINEQRRDAKIRLNGKAWFKLTMFSQIVKTENIQFSTEECEIGS
jgi:hypothetical protein